jgi:hypothetical protein
VKALLLANAAIDAIDQSMKTPTMLAASKYSVSSLPLPPIDWRAYLRPCFAAAESSIAFEFS